MNYGLKVENLHLQTPVSLLIDDPCPCVNPYYYHRKLREKDGEPTFDTGEAIVRSIPLSFLHQFADAVERHGIRGKFSVLPFPCNLGLISKGIEGYPESECREWVSTVRRRLAPLMDFSPELITHLYAVDTETLRPFEENENDWSQHQDEESLTRYIAKALRLLADAGIDANGVTSPWMFAARVEEAYAKAVGNAQKQIHGRKLTWYFLRSDVLSPLVPPVIAAGDCEAGEVVVHVRASCHDVYWDTMGTLEHADAYVRSVADKLISSDLATGRLPTLVAAGSGITLLSHWQSVYSQGRLTGLRALEETARRLSEAYGSSVAWRSCSELAAWTAATATLRCSLQSDGSKLIACLASPFDCPGFTVSFPCERKPRLVRLVSGATTTAVEATDLSTHPAGKLPLPTKSHAWNAGRLSVCLDLHGPARIELET